MAKKSKPKAGSKTKGTVGKAKDTGKKIISAVTGKKEKTGKSHKKSALWYAKEIQRLKLKKKYERVKYRV